MPTNGTLLSSSWLVCGDTKLRSEPCLLAGCRRFRGANPAVDDFLFLLVVPEFTGSFNNDLDFVAHLCVSHSVASFARQLFEDERRVSHFYCDCAIMRDEELHLAFVSSLMALEPVNFHPDSPYLAQQCLRASLDNLRLQPVLWLQQGSGKLEDHVPAARPDKVLPKTDLGALRSKGSLSSVLAGFLAGKRQVDPSLEEGPAKLTEKVVEKKDDGSLAAESAGAADAAQAADGPDEANMVQDSTAEKLEEAALALNETEELLRQMEFEAQETRSRPDLDPEEPTKALLSEALTSCFNVLDLEDMATECPVDDEGPFDAHAVEGSDIQPACEGAGLLKEPQHSVLGGSAADLGAELADAFGLNASMPREDVPEVAIGLRDLVHAGSRARQGDAQRSYLGRRSVPEIGSPPMQASPSSSSRLRAVTATLPLDDHSASAGEADEADDAIAALEGLWRDSRQDTARRLMRASISVASASKLARSDARSRGASDAKSESGASHPGSSRAAHLESPFSGDGSGSDSESSSQRSVSTPSLLALQGEPSTLFPSHGVHLEWKLKMHTRLPKEVQVSRQRGLCPGCRGRLPAISLFQGPRYCHYLGYYFCTDCHHGDIRVIPARVAQRWDFEPKKVCRAVAKYLDLQVNQPLVPITSIRQTKVSSQKILTEIHNCRQQLSRIKDIVAEQGCEFGVQMHSFVAQLDAHIARGHEYYAMQDLIRIHLEGWSCPLYTKVALLCAPTISTLAPNALAVRGPVPFAVPELRFTSSRLRSFTHASGVARCFIRLAFDGQTRSARSVWKPHPFGESLLLQQFKLDDALCSAEDVGDAKLRSGTRFEAQWQAEPGAFFESHDVGEMFAVNENHHNGVAYLRCIHSETSSNLATFRGGENEIWEEVAATHLWVDLLSSARRELMDDSPNAGLASTA
ncbi:Def8 [Symbiodinium necroappetens]|uniref:Def8 protein n=1 Tax=Symbiodinium necroappetens TaxID=1628268 RepID=A0A812VI84_9DINO|nr:Def8 [Symbiodinium necroappetens]